MSFSDAELEEFRMLWKKHYGTEISKEAALEKGLRLVRLMEVAAKQNAHD
jgi:hypothetical protein